MLTKETIHLPLGCLQMAGTLGAIRRGSSFSGGRPFLHLPGPWSRRAGCSDLLPAPLSASRGRPLSWAEQGAP